MKNSQTIKQKESIELGTIWQLGNHRLAFGDAKDKSLIEKLIGKDKINLICVDIPYGIGVVESKQNFKTLFKNKEIANDQLQSHDEYKQFNKDWISAIIP